MIEWSDKEYVNPDPQNCFCLVFVDADAEALLDGVAEVLPDGVAEVLPGGVAEVLPDGVAEVLPGGVAEVLLDGDAALLDLTRLPHLVPTACRLCCHNFQ
jgi:hypothetical protein